MRSLHELLTIAEAEWRDEVRTAHPLWSDMKVEKEGKGPGDWSFSTDLKKINALILNDKRLQERFTGVVTKYWSGAPDELAQETLHYLLFHELYHPLDAPFSVDGDQSDSKRIHQAIRRGIVQAEPKLRPYDQLMKVSAVQNLVKDFILDNRFALENRTAQYVRDDVIPIWDLLELEGKPAKTNAYSITRHLYGLLYGPETTQSFFAEKAGEKGVAAAKQALEALLQEPTALAEPHPSLLKRAKKLLTPARPPEDAKSYVGKIRTVFAGEDRYKGIERLMSVLGPYVDKDMPKGRPDQQGEGSGASSENILQDLLDDMTPEEQQQMLQDVIKEGGKPDDKGPFSLGTQNSVQRWNVSTEERNNLELRAMHEFYKRNHPKVTILGGPKVGESIVVGKRERYILTHSTVISKEALARLNLKNIDRFQKKTRLPMLIPLENDQYRLNEYALREHVIKDIRYVDAQLNVPDHVKFYLDSSGSMFGSGTKKGYNDGTRWDMLSCVVYGLVDGLVQAGRRINKRADVQIFNFADQQVASRILPVEEFWAGAPDVLQTLFKPANGYSVEDINLQSAGTGQTTYIVVTDGALCIGGRTERESKKMKALAKNPENAVVLFEIGGTYDLGNAVRTDPNIHYYQVHDKERMLQHGLEVLLAK